MSRQRMFRSLVLGSVVLKSALSLNAFAWGSVGHSMIAEVASQLATEGHSFWSSNSALLGHLANVPDVVWKQPDSRDQERPTHWFQIDNYVSNPIDFPQALYSYANAIAQRQLPFVTENGTATWRSEQMYDLALAALKKNDDATALQMAGALAHYVGDISQPLHVTRNFDGPAPAKNGIHKFFETDNLNAIDPSVLQPSVTQGAKGLLASGELTKSFSQGILAGTFQEVIRASMKVQTVLDIDSKLGRNSEGSKQQLALAQQRLADGSASLSLVLSQLWKDSGRSDTAKTLNVADPAFVPVNYQGNSLAAGAVIESLGSNGNNQDCGH